MLGRLQEHLERLKVKLVVRLDLRRIRDLLEQEPHLAQRNLWGQAVPAAGGLSEQSGAARAGALCGGGSPPLCAGRVRAAGLDSKRGGAGRDHRCDR